LWSPLGFCHQWSLAWRMLALGAIEVSWSRCSGWWLVLCWWRRREVTRSRLFDICWNQKTCRLAGLYSALFMGVSCQNLFDWEPSLDFRYCWFEFRVADRVLEYFRFWDFFVLGLQRPFSRCAAGSSQNFDRLLTFPQLAKWHLLFVGLHSQCCLLAKLAERKSCFTSFGFD